MTRVSVKSGLQPDDKADLCSSRGCRFDFESAAGCVCSLLHAYQSESCSTRRPIPQALEIEAHAVVFYNQRESFCGLAQLQGHVAGARVTHDVRESFLCDPKTRRLEIA